jgi:hypothetical protein
MPMQPLDAPRPRYPAGLRPSLLGLGAIIALALLGLAGDGNWSKMLRVALATGTYATLLLAFCRWQKALHVSAFLMAGAAAGAVSGVVRPAIPTPALVVASALGAGLLLGPLHWWALRTWQRLGQRQAGGAA